MVSRKTRILVLNDHQQLSPRVQYEVESLAQKYEVSVLSWDRAGNTEQDRRTEYIHLTAPSGSLLLVAYLPILYIKFWRRIRKHNPDIIHITHILFLPLVVVLSFFMSIRVVYDVYERYAIEISQYFPLSPIVRGILERFENSCCRSIDLILTVDTNDDILVERYQSVHHNVEVLYNVPPKFTPSPSEELKSEYESKNVLVYVGHLSEAKGAVKMIEAFEVLASQQPTAILLLIGTYLDSQQQVERQIANANLSGRVHHIEWLAYNDMMEYLAIADVGLALHQPRSKFKYVSTGTGRKFFTYMQASLPIIGPDFWEIGEVIRETGCGILVDTTDPNAIADSIEELLDNPERGDELGRRGRLAIEEQYNWESESEKLMSKYSSLAGRNKN